MWDWLIYGSLAAALLLPTAALAFVVVRVLQGFRDFKRLRRHVFRDLDRVFEKLEVTLEHAARASDTSRLDASLAKLRRSLAQLAVLRAAYEEATSFTALIPRK